MKYKLYDIYKKITAARVSFNIRRLHDKETTINSYDKMFERFSDSKNRLNHETIENVIEEFKDVQTMESLSEFNLFKYHVTLVSYFDNFCSSEIDKELDSLGSFEAVQYLLGVLYNVQSGMDKYTFTHSYLHNIRFRIPTGHDYADVYKLLIKRTDIMNDDDMKQFKDIFDPLVELIERAKKEE